MNEHQRQIGFWVLLATSLALLVFLLVKTNQELNTAATTNTVSFNGSGKVLATPDVAILDLAIVTDGTTSKEAQDANSKKSKTLTDFLKGQDIDENDIKTTGYNIYPQYTYPSYAKPQITGYQVNQTIQVKVRDLEKIDRILDGVVTNGVNQINSFQYTIDDAEELREQARQKAIADAREKSDKLEGQLGIHLGKVVGFSENTAGFPVPVYYDRAASGGGMGGGGPSVPAGQNEIVVDVTLTYQIK